MTELRMWSMPPGPASDVRYVRDRDGDVWERMQNSSEWECRTIPGVGDEMMSKSWEALLRLYGPLAEVEIEATQRYALGPVRIRVQVTEEIIEAAQQGGPFWSSVDEARPVLEAAFRAAGFEVVQ